MDIKNLGALVSRNEFSNIPMEYVVPKNCDIVFVQDFFVQEVNGGAERTSDALSRKDNKKVFNVHSTSVTTKFLENNRNFHYVFGNFTMMPVESITFLIENNIKYSIVEYDYKYCSFRSEKLHKKQTGHECDCALRPNGMLVEKFYENAKKIFWMSNEQKEHFLTKIPSLAFIDDEKHIILGSVWTKEDIDYILSLKNQRENRKKLPIKIWAIQASNNWIKGTEDTIKYCNEKRYAVKVLQNMEYYKFLEELSKCDGFVFHPLDFDTCPRVVVEAKLMGLELDINNNVQIKNDIWLNGSQEELLTHLNSRLDVFWNNIES